VRDQRREAPPGGTVSPSIVSVLQLRAAAPAITFRAVGENRSYGARAELNKSTSIDESKDERGLDLWSGESAIVARLEKEFRRAVEVCGAKLDPF
jgi:hypothetical protein